MRSVKPAIILTLTDNWITFNIRYIAEARKRRELHNKLSRLILTKIQASKNIEIASELIDITAFPDIMLKQK